MLGSLSRIVCKHSSRRNHLSHTSAMIHCPPDGDAIKFHNNNNNHNPVIMVRPYSVATPVSMPLEEFRDTVSRQTRTQEPVGRSWSAKELRRKSYEDLQKLWYVLYKERNMLLTEQQLSRRKGIIFPQPERMGKVRKSMGAIKQVLGERKRATLAAARLTKEDKDGNTTTTDGDNINEDSVTTTSNDRNHQAAI